MSVALLPLCSLGKTAMRDAYVGAQAKIILPYYGFWYADGKTCTNPSALIPQSRAINLAGTRKPDTYRKDCCDCIGS